MCACTQASGDFGVADLVVTQVHRIAGRRKCAPDRCSDQPRSDDHDAADPALVSAGGWRGLAHVPAGFFGGSSAPPTEL